MATIQEQIENKKKRRSYDSPAKDLISNLKRMTENISDYQKRWFWELLQNASDFNQHVNVCLKIDRNNNEITFTHNGKPFTVDDAMNLIAPDTAKDNVDRISENHVIGKFGTGFISTHVIASKIDITGQINNTETHEKKQFTFRLDRLKYDNRDDLIQSIVDAEKSFVESQIDYLKTEFITEFKYDLNSCYSFINSDDTISSGIEFIGKVIPYVLAFNNKLEEIKIIDGNETLLIKKQNKELSPIEFTTLTKFEVEGSLSKFPVYDLLKSALVWTSGNWKKTNVENSPLSKIACLIINGAISSSEGLPIIFCDFPLIGSEKYPFPTPINSHQFIPTTERNDISLISPDKTNLTILELAANGFEQLLDYCETEITTIKNVWELARISKDQKMPQLTKSVESYFQNLLKAKIVNTKIGHLKVNECLFCYKGSLSNENFKAFADLSYELLDNVPTYEETQYWSKYLPLQDKIFEHNKLTIEILCKTIKPYLTTLFEFENKFKIQNSIAWLKYFYEYLKNSDSLKLFETYEIILNQNNCFIKYGNDINWEDGIDELLFKSYHSLFKIDLKDSLVASDFLEISDSLPKITTLNSKGVCSLIDSKLKKDLEFQTDSYYIEAVTPLIDYTANMDEEIIHEHFPWFASQRLSFVLNTIANPKDRHKYFEIYKSGKVDLLAQIAGQSYTSVELKAIAQNPELIKYILANEQTLSDFMIAGKKIEAISVDGFKIIIIDDEQYANSVTGDRGESIVYEELQKLFKEPDYNVIWASKYEAQPAYDFRIVFKGKIFLYVDAKTTTTAVTQSDSVPFFLKKSQWDFIQTLQNKYMIARVFLGSNPVTVKFLKVSMFATNALN